MKEILELLEHNARLTTGELASMLQKSEYEIERDISALEKAHNVKILVKPAKQEAAPAKQGAAPAPAKQEAAPAPAKK